MTRPKRFSPWQWLVLAVHETWLWFERLLARFDRWIRPAPGDVEEPAPTEPVVLSVLNAESEMSPSEREDEALAEEPRVHRGAFFWLRRCWRRARLRTSLALTALGAGVAAVFASGESSAYDDEESVVAGTRLVLHHEAEEIIEPAPPPRRRGNPAWTLAAITGTIGIILMFWLQSSSVPAAIRSTQAVAALEMPSKLEPDLGPPAPLETPIDEPGRFRRSDIEWQEPAFPAVDNEQAVIDDPLPPLPPDPFDFPEPSRPAPVPPPDLELAVTRVAPPEPPPPGDPPEQFLVESMADAPGDMPLELRELAGLDDPLFGNSLPVDPLDAMLMRDEWNRALPGLPRTPDPPSLYRDRLTPEQIARLEAELNGPVEPQAETATSDLQVSIEKQAPTESAAHEPLEYEIIVRNSGDNVLRDLTVNEQLPAGHAVTDVIPEALLREQSLRWKLRDLGPGEEERLRVRLVAAEEGAFESVTQLHGTSAVTALTLVEGVRLRLEVTAPPTVPQNEPCVFQFKITNVGRVDASGVVLRHDLPNELSYHVGRHVDYLVGNLAPGQSHEARLTARADEIAAAASTSALLVGQNVVETAQTGVEITAPLPPTSRRATPRPQPSFPPINWSCVPCCP